MHGAVLPTVLDVTVETQDYTHLTLKVRTASAFFLHEFYGKRRSAYMLVCSLLRAKILLRLWTTTCDRKPAIVKLSAHAWSSCAYII